MFQCYPHSLQHKYKPAPYKVLWRNGTVSQPNPLQYVLKTGVITQNISCILSIYQSCVCWITVHINFVACTLSFHVTNHSKEIKRYGAHSLDCLKDTFIFNHDSVAFLSVWKLLRKVCTFLSNVNRWTWAITGILNFWNLYALSWDFVAHIEVLHIAVFPHNLIFKPTPFFFPPVV